MRLQLAAHEARLAELPPHLDGLSPEEAADFLEWRARVAGCNISDKTLLATDYLNHFNEIVMLVEMVPDMPMMLEECRIWEPTSYPDFVRASSFSERDLAVAAYDHVPRKFRDAFEWTIARFDHVVAHILGALEALGEADPELLRIKCDVAVQAMQELIGAANGIIHGETPTLSQDQIDDFLASV
jgi:hypothetical protein